MYISELVNEYAKPYTPYMRELVNHLPMGQLALYHLSKDFKKIKSYSEYYVKNFKINLVDSHYTKVDSIEECLGKRKSYEPCLERVTEAIETEGLDEVIRKTLNRYPYGISSGLFHTTIRLFYAVEGFKVDKGLKEEVARALAYYVTGYKEAKKFKNRIKSSDFNDQMKALMNDPYINKLMESNPSTGQKIKAMYNDQNYLNEGFVIEGGEEEKIRTLLGFLIPMHDHYQNIIILHCITGLQALIGLKDRFEDFDEILDIMTTCIITHLLTIEGLTIQERSHVISEKKWEDIIREGADSKDIHMIKCTYTCNELDKLYDISALKESVMIKINKDSRS